MRPRAEQEHARLQQRLRLALEANRMCALDYDVIHDRFQCSAEPAAVAGTTLESLTGPLSRWLSSVHPDDRARVERAIGDAVDHGQELSVETRIITGSTGRTGWLLARGG